MGPWKASNRRTVHIAIDVFADEGTELFAPLEGEVFTAEYRDSQLDYGGVIILKHTTPHKDEFFTLYGHLDPIFLSNLKVGDKIEKGQSFCQLGAPNVNGGWAPHVHFQLALTTDGMELTGQAWLILTIWTSGILFAQTRLSTKFKRN